MNDPFRRRAPRTLRHALACAAACSVAAGAAAQAPHTDATVVITGNPLARDAVAAPVSSLSGAGLQRRRAATLGDTLDGLPGVAASGFGPHSSRPVIRGLDGDRVRLLDNGGAAVDASNLSFDHAVALDPLVAERVEVLRGPAALLYGGNATGGVVNVIDNRIPRVPPDGVGGRAELRVGGAAREQGGAAVLEGGSGAWAWHADAFGRDTDDQRSPLFTPVEDGVAGEPTRRVRNSAGRSRGGAVGSGWVGNAGHLGVAVDTLRHDYGVTVEPDVTIRLARDRLALGGAWRADGTAGGWLRAATLKAGHTRYEHQEVEGDGAVGTTFSSRGDDLRLELRHASWAGIEGVVGLQLENLRFSALGEEAFVPGTRTRSQALFTLQEWRRPGLALSAGVRVEQARVASDGDAPKAPEPRFGAPLARRFTPVSGAVSATAGLGGGWQLQASAGQTQRAPAYYELYANGVHLATAAYEVGDTGLGLERSRHAELGLAWRGGSVQLKAAAFTTRFASFIALDATGVDIDVAEPGDPPDLVPEYRFSAVRARLQGLELEARVDGRQGIWRWGLTGQLDTVRADNLSRGEPLPRVAPLRARLGLEAGAGAWTAGLELQHQARQGRVPALDTPTGAATRLGLWLRGEWAARASVWLKLDNATDELAYNPVAVATVRGLSPQPGRALAVGVSARW